MGDILVDASGESDLQELPQETAVKRVERLNSFLGQSLGISIDGSDAVIRSNAGQPAGPKSSKLCERAKAAVGSGRYQQAARLYQQYLATAPGSVEVRRNLGMAYLELGDEYELVDQVAAELRVQGWYDWQKDEELPSEEVGGVTNQELLDLKEPAAVMYCLGALERFDAMRREEILRVVSEIALMGQSGLDYASSEKKYSLKSVPGEHFSGLQLLCMMYVGFKDVDPTVDVGADLSDAFETALKLHGQGMRSDSDV